MSQFDDTTRKATGNVDITITSLEDAFDENVLSKVEAVEGVLCSSARLTRTAKIEGLVLGIVGFVTAITLGLIFQSTVVRRDSKRGVVRVAVHISLGGDIA